MPTASLSLANTATALMFTQVPYFVVGNLIIGVVEGLLIARLFKTRAMKTIGLMIIANYFSAMVGFAIFGLGNVRGIFSELWHPDILNYPLWIAGAIATSFLVSVLLEWPLCYCSFDKSTRPHFRSLRACIAAQVLSYLVCLGSFSGLYGEIRIRDVVEIVPASAMVSAELPFQVYFIDPDDGDIYRMRLDGSSTELYREAELEKRGRLALYSSESMIDPKVKFDLYALGDEGRIMIQESFASSESAFRDIGDPGISEIDSLNNEMAADLRRSENQDWIVQTKDWWGIRWARCEPDQDPWDAIFGSKQRYDLLFTTTFGTWQGRNASILPGDIVIFEFGGQICALDLNEKKLAFIRFGFGPVVVRDDLELSSDSDHTEDAANQVHRAEDSEAAPGEDED